MKKYFSYLGFAICVVLVLGSLFVACSKDVDDFISDSTQNKSMLELQDYLNSDEYKTFLKRHDLLEGNVIMGSVPLASYVKDSVSVYVFSVESNGNFVGKLYVSSYEDNYVTLYEDWSNANLSLGSGLITVTDGDGQYIATLSVHKVHGIIHTTVEMVTQETHMNAPGETWWQCVTRVYSEAKKACGNEPSCQFLCDLADVVTNGACTLSIAAAAAIACAIYG